MKQFNGLSSVIFVARNQKTCLNHSFSLHFTVCAAISIRFKPLQVRAWEDLGFSREGEGRMIGKTGQNRR